MLEGVVSLDVMRSEMEVLGNVPLLLTESFLISPSSLVATSFGAAFGEEVGADPFDLPVEFLGDVSLFSEYLFTFPP